MTNSRSDRKFHHLVQENQTLKKVSVLGVYASTVHARLYYR